MRKVIWVIVIISLLMVPFTSTWAAKKTSNEFARVTVGSLNVREDASSKAAVISSLHKGAIVEVLDEAFGWLQIQANGVTGWVAGYYLKKESELDDRVTPNSTPTSTKSSTTKEKKVHVLENGLRVREGPATNYAILSSVNKGDQLTTLESTNEWSKVRIPTGIEGWVASQYIGDVSSKQSAKKTALTKSNSLSGRTILIDPGHGGNDPGAVGTTYKTHEKELNLSTALLLKQELIARGAKVIMTRTKNDQKISLSNRAALANTKGADAFVSIHYNSSDTDTSGTLTFYQSESKDLRLTRAVERRLADNDTGLKSNGIAFGDYHVLRENSVPSTLVELGFLTNANDEGIVRKSDYQKKAATAIAEGLADYFAN